jgi:UDP-N-acetylglucosamine--N-acetylmuramyl-(pentapeptide) pyrophosphoryl-undecaprenol N-acetylglucosamine transferase
MFAMSNHAQRGPNRASHSLRLAIAGGGTGGHVHPALAVVNELKARQQLSDVIWLGSSASVEQEAAQRAGMQFIAIPTGKLRRYLSLQNFTDALKVPLGILAARRALASFKPSVVLSTGGFVSVPTVLAAWRLAPVITHEQTATIGLANRINARFADVLAVSFEPSRVHMPKLHRDIRLTGNPVRPQLLLGERDRGLKRLGFSADVPVVYVTGGARGASPINQRIEAVLPDLLARTQVIHQTGPASANNDAEKLKARRATLPDELRDRYYITEFVGEDLPDVYATADLIVGRSGAGTIAELALVGKPAILIPLPGTGGDEQSVNAHLLADAGAAVLLPQSEATPERLLAEVTALLGNFRRRDEMAKSATSIARPDAAARLADIVVELSAGQAATHRSS